MSPIDVTCEQLASLPPERLEAVQGLLTGWLAESEPEIVPIPVEVAQRVVNDWLLRTLPDRFMALEPRLIAGGDIWSVPVGLAYPHIGVVGQVGEVLISAFSRGIISSTRPEAMKSAGAVCYKEKEDAINAAFLSARDA